MKVLVIGGTGFISGKLVEQLLADGIEVTTLNRGKSRNRLTESQLLKTVAGDRNDTGLLKNLAAKNYDAVFDMIAYTPEESEMMVKYFKGKTSRFIHCSTISVYMVSGEVTTPVTEDQDKLPVMDYWPENPFGMDYGLNKRKCEDVLWAAHGKDFPVSMIRPPYVCGPYDPMKRDYFWIERIKDGGPLLVPGSGDFAYQVVHVDDVASAFGKLLYKENSAGEAYNIGDEEFFSLNEYLGKLAVLLDRNPEFVNVDQQIFDKLPFARSPHGDAFPFNTRRTAVFSVDKAKRELGYTSTPYTEWLGKTVDWYLKEFNGSSVGYENRHEEINFIEKWKKEKDNFRKNLGIEKG